MLFEQFRPNAAALKCLPAADPFTREAFLQARQRFHLLRLLTHLPDRLSGPRWQSRFRLENQSIMEDAVKADRPLVLIALHHGGMLILRPALRALGYPVATLVAERLEDRPAIKVHKDALTPIADVPRVFSGQYPKAAMRFLKSGGAMITILDHHEGVPLVVDIPGGTWRVSSTPLRLASHAGARVLPVLIWEESPWRFVIRPGNAVPDEFVLTPDRFPEALRFLWQEFAPMLEQAPRDGHIELYSSLAGTPVPVGSDPTRRD